jgi:hypothetical protein
LGEFADMQQRNLFAEPVGIVIQTNNPFLPNTVTSGPVGVLVNSNAAYFSKAVGVFYGHQLTGPLISSPVGVLISSRVNFVQSAPIGTFYGSELDSSQPASALAGTTIELIATGLNLGEVQSVAVVPADDVTVGEISINSEGTQLSVPITINLNASTGQRELAVQDNAGPVPTLSGLPLTLNIQ